MKTNSSFVKKNNDFGYILPNSCFTKHSQCPLLNILILQQGIFFSLSEMKTQEMNSQESKERKFEEKVREKVWAVLIFT